MCGFQHRFGERPARIEPVTVQPDIVFAPLDPVDRHPVDKVGRRRPTDPREQGQPGCHRLGAPPDRGDRAFDPRARRAVHPVGPFLQHRFEPAAEADERADQGVQRMRRRASRLDQGRIRLGQLGLQSVARIGTGILARLGPRIGQPAHRREQRLDRPERRALAQPLQPTLACQRARGHDRFGNRPRAALVIARDIGQARLQPAPPPAPAGFGSENPAPDLDRLATGQRGREH